MQSPFHATIRINYLGSTNHAGRIDQLDRTKHTDKPSDRITLLSRPKHTGKTNYTDKIDHLGRTNHTGKIDHVTF